MERINIHVNTREDEALWNWFQHEFGMAYTDTIKKDAMTRMLALRMQQNNLNMYIAMFDNLREVASWGRNLQGTILLFQCGLYPALAQAFINQTLP